MAAAVDADVNPKVFYGFDSSKAVDRVCGSIQLWDHDGDITECIPIII